jgi:hypothetical protein
MAGNDGRSQRTSWDCACMGGSIGSAWAMRNPQSGGVIVFENPCHSELAREPSPRDAAAAISGILSEQV